MAAAPPKTLALVPRILRIAYPADGSEFMPTTVLLTKATADIINAGELGWAYLYEVGNNVPLYPAQQSFQFGNDLFNVIVLPGDPGKSYYIQVTLYLDENLLASDIVGVSTVAGEIYSALRKMT